MELRRQTQPLCVFARTASVALAGIAAPSSLADCAADAVPLTSLQTRSVDNRQVIPVKIGDYELSFVLDTGASKSALFQSLDNDYVDLPRDGTAQVIFPALNEQIEGDRLTALSVVLGSYTYQKTGMLVIRKRPPVGDRLNFRFDGILGQDFYASHVVELEPKINKLNVYPAGTDLSCRFFTKLDLLMHDTAPHVRFSHMLPWEHRTSTKELLVDTGYPGIMVIWSAKHFANAVGSGNVARYQAENKGIVTRATFKINRLRFSGAPVFVAPKVPLQLRERDGLLGANVINTFHHAFDFGRKKLLLGRSRINFGQIDGSIYVPNNETVEFKKFHQQGIENKIVIGNEDGD